MKKRFSNSGRYKPREEKAPTLTLSGRVFLKYEDEAEHPRAGDVTLSLNTDGKPYPALKGNYHETGYTGHFRAEVFDGNHWQFLSVEEMFPEKENYYARHERAIDRYALCVEMVSALTGRGLVRTYREHYKLADEA